MPFRLTLPFPSGSITTEDRVTLGGGYAGSPFSPPPPPVSDRYILGTCMIKQGSTIRNQGTSPLINKGTVADNLNVIPH